MADCGIKHLSKAVSLFNLGCTKRSPTAIFHLPFPHLLLFFPKCHILSFFPFSIIPSHRILCNQETTVVTSNDVKLQSMLFIFLKRLDIVERESMFFFFLSNQFLKTAFEIILHFYNVDISLFNLLILSFKSTMCSWAT